MWKPGQEGEPIVEFPKPMRTLARRLRGAAILAAALLVLGPAAAVAGESYVFAVGLRGNPEVGCMITTGGEPCQEGRVQGAVVSDGTPAFVGHFNFKLPGLREDRAPLGRKGRGRLDGDFTVATDAEPLRCKFTGRVRAQGVLMPSDASALRFHTGTFEARGRCGDRPAVMKAIWSGAIGNSDGPFILSFERFQGRLAGSIRFSGRHSIERFYLP